MLTVMTVAWVCLAMHADVSEKKLIKGNARLDNKLRSLLKRSLTIERKNLMEKRIRMTSLLL